MIADLLPAGDGGTHSGPLPRREGRARPINQERRIDSAPEAVILLAVLADLEMEVGAGAVAGVAGEPDELADFGGGAGFDVELGEVGIDGAQAAGDVAD